MTERRYVWVQDRRGTRMPFSKGILVNSIMVTGIDPEAGYRLAEAVEDHLFDEGRGVVEVEDLTTTTALMIERHLGEEAARTWRAWVEARRAGHPIVVLMGGATGSGKSTVATRLAAQLGIPRVVATDAIREVMRGGFPETILPVLHVSSFEAHLGLRAPLPEGSDPVVSGFRQQAEMVASGVRRLVNRAFKEGTDLVLEGVHLIPGMLMDDLERWKKTGAITQMVLAVSDPEQHRAHFLTRLERSHSRRPQRYLDNLEAIRTIQRYILLQARRYGVPELEVGNLDEVVRQAVRTVVSRVTASQSLSAEATPGEAGTTHRRSEVTTEG